MGVTYNHPAVVSASLRMVQLAQVLTAVIIASCRGALRQYRVPLRHHPQHGHFGCQAPFALLTLAEAVAFTTCLSCLTESHVRFIATVQGSQWVQSARSATAADPTPRRLGWLPEAGGKPDAGAVAGSPHARLLSSQDEPETGGSGHAAIAGGKGPAGAAQGSEPAAVDPQQAETVAAEQVSDSGGAPAAPTASPEPRGGSGAAADDAPSQQDAQLASPAPDTAEPAEQQAPAREDAQSAETVPDSPADQVASAEQADQSATAEDAASAQQAEPGSADGGSAAQQPSQEGGAAQAGTWSSYRAVPNMHEAHPAHQECVAPLLTRLTSALGPVRLWSITHPNPHHAEHADREPQMAASPTRPTTSSAT